MTLGWLNSLDINDDYAKQALSKGKRAFLNEGIFLEWYKMIEGDSFDVQTAVQMPSINWSKMKKTSMYY